MQMELDTMYTVLYKGGIAINLIKVIHQIQSDIDKAKDIKKEKIKQIEEDCENLVAKLEIALKVNKDMNTTCLKCEGTGKIRVYEGDSYENRGSWKTCDKCKGSGLEPKEKEENNGE